MSDLHTRHPAELPEGTPALAPERVAELLAQLDPAWRVEPGEPDTLARDFESRDFRDAFGFATRIALLVEREFHHPELGVTWGRVSVRLWTHTVDGLSDNDFIVAARIDRL